MELCKCIPFTSTTSGMPYLLLIKLQALKRPMLGHQADDFLALSAAVRKALGTRYKRIVFETVAIFYSNFTENTYLLHVIRAREERRYDAKNSAFKELAQYLEGPPFLRLVSRKSKYDAKLTNSIIIWTDPVGVYRASDTKTDLELHEVFTDDELVITLRWSQELSKLLFCKQVELNDTEYSEKHGVVSINVSSIDYHTTHYFHTAINKIRICTEDFRKGFPMASSSFTLPNFTVAVYLGFLLWCFLV